jgi:uncharacterized protein (TIGR03067 family)
MRPAVLSLLALALSAVAAPAPLPKRAKYPPSLEGEWRQTHQDDEPLFDRSRVATLHIRGNQMTFRWRGSLGLVELDAEFKVQPGPQPAPIDVRIVRYRQGDKTNDANVLLRGLYRVEGNALRMTFGKSGRPRSLDDEFATREVFVRVRR